jgi:hypothetical protein
MIEPLKKLYTVTEYYALVGEGVLREDDRMLQASIAWLSSSWES